MVVVQNAREIEVAWWKCGHGTGEANLSGTSGKAPNSCGWEQIPAGDSIKWPRLNNGRTSNDKLGYMVGC
jgi:hypothetical protein